MPREHIMVIEDESVERGKPEFSGDGKSISSIVVRHHPEDKDMVLVKVKAAIRELGGENIRFELPV